MCVKRTSPVPELDQHPPRPPSPGPASYRAWTRLAASNAAAAASTSRALAGNAATRSWRIASSVGGTGNGGPVRIRPPEALQDVAPAPARRTGCRPMPRGLCAASDGVSAAPNRSRKSLCSAPMLSGADPNRKAAFLRDGQLEPFRVQPRRLPGAREERHALLREVACRANSSTGGSDRSSHCKSSTASTTGFDAARMRNTPSKATPRVCRSGGGPSESRRRSAISSARRWGRGSPGSTSSSTSAREVAHDAVRERFLLLSRARPQNAVGQLARGLDPGTARESVFPMPASPSMSRAPDGGVRFDERGNRPQFLIATDDLSVRHGPPWTRDSSSVA